MLNADSPGTGRSFQLPIARMHTVYKVDDVERKLSRLPDREHESLRTMYEHMLEMGEERFQVKPSGLPAMDGLYETLPNFHEALDDVKRQLALCVDSGDPLEIAPMLLLGPPGVGKTHFGRSLAKLLDTGFERLPMSSLTAGWIISGSSSQWNKGRPGKVFQGLVEGQFANPLMLIDEIDKALPSQQYDPMGAFYDLLEFDTARSFKDEYAEVDIDASQVIWIATANDERGIPSAVLDRLNVIEIDKPVDEAARKIAEQLHDEIRSSHRWGESFDPAASRQMLDALAEIEPRAMRRSLQTAFGNAKLANRSTLLVADLPHRTSKKNPIGFVRPA